jgi:predicted phage terminase large subunit-like protein
MNKRRAIQMNERTVLVALLHSDLRYFIWKCFKTILPGERFEPNWHVDAIVYQLLRVQAGETTRLIINQPPRSLKSICVSVAYVAWLLGHDPTRRIVVLSYSSELAAELHRQFRMVVEAPWYRALFPAMCPAKDTRTELVTTAGGSRYATSVGGTLTGRGADLIVIDDPLKPEEAMSEPARKRVIDWYSGTLISRLNDKERGAIILVMQRLHEDDLAGHLLEKGSWEHLELSAIAEKDCIIQIGPDKFFTRWEGDVLHAKRESRASLDRTKAESGPLMFSAQYQQRPVPAEGNLIKREWFRFYERLPSPSPGDLIVQSWDVASTVADTSSYSVCTTWRIMGPDYYLVDVFRGRLLYPDLRRTVISLAEKYGATVILIERAGPGLHLFHELRIDPHLPVGMIRPMGIKPEGSKQERMAAQSTKIEAGHVHLPTYADWLAAFLLEVLAFPNGRHDDQVDSLSQLLKWVGGPRFEIPLPGIGLPFTGREPGSDDGSSDPGGPIIGVF